MFFTASGGLDKKLRGWALASRGTSDLKVRQFIVAVDDVVRRIGTAPRSVSDYAVKAWDFKVKKKQFQANQQFVLSIVANLGKFG